MPPNKRNPTKRNPSYSKVMREMLALKKKREALAKHSPALEWSRETRDPKWKLLDPDTGKPVTSPMNAGTKRRGVSKPKVKRNPEQTAAELSERFHGRPVKRVTDIETTTREYAELTDLGKLVALVVNLTSGKRVQLDFKGVRLCSSPDGGQLFFEEGDQALDLEALKLNKYLPKAYLDVGLVEKVVYATKRPAYGYAEWHHEFAEDGGELPTLAYDVLNQEIKLIGGSYQTGEWIEN
jgi:hypothetical protein